MIRIFLACLLVLLFAAPTQAKFEALPRLEQSLNPVDWEVEFVQMKINVECWVLPVIDDVAAAIWHQQFGPRPPPR